MAGDRIFNFHGSAVFNDIHDNKDCTIIVPSPTDNVKAVAGQMATTPKKKPKSKSGTDKPVRLHGDNFAVFRMGKGFCIDLVKPIYKWLVGKRWVSEQTPPEDFKMLFGGGANDCEIGWTGEVGMGTLKYLFDQLEEKKVIVTPNGIGVNMILEAHFVDKDGDFISGLNSSKESQREVPNVDALIAAIIRPITDNSIAEMFGDIRNQASDSY